MTVRSRPKDTHTAAKVDEWPVFTIRSSSLNTVFRRVDPYVLVTLNGRWISYDDHSHITRWLY